MGGCVIRGTMLNIVCIFNYNNVQITALALAKFPITAKVTEDCTTDLISLL